MSNNENEAWDKNRTEHRIIAVGLRMRCIVYLKSLLWIYIIHMCTSVSAMVWDDIRIKSSPKRVDVHNFVLFSSCVNYINSWNQAHHIFNTSHVWLCSIISKSYGFVHVFFCDWFCVRIESITEFSLSSLLYVPFCIRSINVVNQPTHL